jgi:hypothetical protein
MRGWSLGFGWPMTSAFGDFSSGETQLVAKQVQKEYGCNDDKMADYLAEV